jgi:hypothetical protein
MHERARLLGGQLEVTSAPDEGTRIIVRIPAPARGDGTEEPPATNTVDGRRELASAGSASTGSGRNTRPAKGAGKDGA